MCSTLRLPSTRRAIQLTVAAMRDLTPPPSVAPPCGRNRRPRKDSLVLHSAGLARQRLDHGKPSFGRAAQHVNSPFLGTLTGDDVLTQGWKPLSFQLLQDRSKSLSDHCVGVTDKFDLKTGCQQIAARFNRRDKETDVSCGSPWQRIVGCSSRPGAGEGQSEQPARAKHPERFAKDA